MGIITKFRDFNENATGSASSAGSGDVSNPVIGGEFGSGDIPFYLKRGQRKMGRASEVSDLRDLKPEKVKKIKDIKNG